MRIEIPEKPMTISEAAELTGLSEDTLRYYERIELLPPAERKPNGHRFYTNEQVQMIIFITRLKATGMKLEDIKHFRLLNEQGDHTLQTRKMIIEACYEQVTQEMERLHKLREVLKYKLEHYDRLATDPQLDDDGCEPATYSSLYAEDMLPN